MISNKNPIQDSIDTAGILRTMSEAYAELAANRLNQIRYKIEKNRQFAVDLAHAFHEVKTAASHFNLPARQKKPWLNVILCSNYGFFFNSEIDLMRLYMKSDLPRLQAGQTNGDLLIVGRSGVDAFYTLGTNKPFEVMIFEHDLPSLREIGEAADRMAAYERVVVFYSQFRTVAAQTPTYVDISGEVAAAGSDVKDQVTRVILEPEAPKLLDFFESQILKLLLEQTFLETELARTATRMLMMDSAQNRAGDYIKLQKRLLRAEQRRHFGVKILEMSLGYLARKKTINS